MKHCLLYGLTALFLTISVPGFAGFWSKKTTATSSMAVANHSDERHTLSTLTQAHDADATSISAITQRPFMQNFAYRGWLGILSVLFGVFGLFNPGWSIAAVLFGVLGLGRRKRNNSLAAVGLILGIVVICLVIYGGFDGFPLF